MYKVFGPRLTEVGAPWSARHLKQPFHPFDVWLRQRLSAVFGFSLQAANLLDLPVTPAQGPRTAAAFTEGHAGSMRVTGCDFTL